MPGWQDAPEVTAPKWASAPEVSPEQPEPGPVGKVLRWLTTPFKGMEDTVARNKQINAENPGPLSLKSDSGDIRTGAQAFLSGIPGYQRDAEDPEAQDRMKRFRTEHPIASILLPLAGGLGKPAMLPAQVAREPGMITRVLDDVANKAGRRTLYGGANALSERFPVPDASIEAARRAGAFRPLGTTEHAADVLSDALDEAGALKGDVVQQMMDAGIKGPDSANLAQLLRSKAAWMRKNTAGSNIPDLYERAANDIEAAGEGGRLTVQQAENIKKSLQDQVVYGMPNERMPNMARKNIASTVRQGVEDASGADAVTLGTPEAEAANAALVPAKSAYALLKPAAAAAEKGLSQATKRNAFSLRDTLMAAPMAAVHGPAAAIETGLITKALRHYGPSTIAWAADNAAKLTGSQFIDGLVARGVPQSLAEEIASSGQQ